MKNLAGEDGEPITHAINFGEENWKLLLEPLLPGVLQGGLCTGVFDDKGELAACSINWDKKNKFELNTSASEKIFNLDFYLGQVD